MPSSNGPSRCLNAGELLEESNKEGGSTHESGRKAVADYNTKKVCQSTHLINI